MNQPVEALLDSVSIKTSILREWHESHVARPQGALSPREQLCLELVADMGPSLHITETIICKVFGIHFSSASNLVKKLSSSGLMTKPGKGQPLELTDKGKEFVQAYKKARASRFSAFFAEIKNKDDWAAMERLLKAVDSATTKLVIQWVFDGLPPVAIESRQLGD